MTPLDTIAMPSSVGPGQTVQMRRLIWDYVDRKML